MKWLFLPLCALGGVGVAALLVTLVGDPSASSSTELTYTPTDPAQPQGPSILLAGVRGAPGDGNAALSKAIGQMLAQTQVPLVEKVSRCTVSVSAEVAMQENGATEKVRILWRVHDADGRALGEVAQVNEGPTGTLDGTWGENALMAAHSARGGIMDIIGRARSGCQI